MPQKNKQRRKGVKTSAAQTLSVGKLGRTTVVGRDSYEIVNPRKTRGDSIVTALATQGIYVAAAKGTKASAIEKKLRSLTLQKLGDSTARAEAGAPRARLVGSGLRHSESKGDLPWATDAEITAVVDMADTLSSDDMAERLSTNRETIKQWRTAGRLIGVEGAKRGVRYPSAQIGKNMAPLDGIEEVLKAMSGDAWETWRFLAGEIDELDGKTGFDVLRVGGKKELLEVIQARSDGSFS